VADFSGISSVSKTLRNLLLNRMEAKPPITFAPPGVAVDSVGGDRLNLYLYQISESAHLKNQDIPHRGAGAAGRPPLSLLLYYLMTAYPADEADGEADLKAQIILADAMTVMHDYAMIPPTLHVDGDPDLDPILDQNLLKEFERIKIRLHPMGLEEFSKIWTGLPQASFRRSVVYEVSVVQIESRLPRRYPQRVKGPPTHGPRVYALPLNRPRIEAVRVIRAQDAQKTEWPYPYVRTGDTLVLTGENLFQPHMRVQMDETDLEIESAASRRLACKVPAADELRPGPRPVTIVVDVPMGDPATPHPGFKSNTAVVALVPGITGIETDPAAQACTVTGSHLYYADLDCMTLVGDTQIPAALYQDPKQDVFTIQLPDLPGGPYPLRVRVNGMENIETHSIQIP
jgi:hypothetical protein